MPDDVRYRGMSINLPAWWLREVRLLADKKAGWTQQRLADALTAVYGGKYKWTREVVRDFLAGKHTTIEMTEAFCVLFDGLPMPQFAARDIREATRMQIVAREFDTGPEKAKRLTMLNAALAEHERLAADQIAKLDSRDEEGSRNRGRRGSMERSRPPTS